MSNDTIIIIMGVIAFLFFAIVVAYLLIRKRLQSSDVARIEKLRKGTRENTFSSEILYQKISKKERNRG